MAENVFFTKEINNTIKSIAYELEEMNRLKRQELRLKYGDRYYD